MALTPPRSCLDRGGRRRHRGCERLRRPPRGLAPIRKKNRKCAAGEFPASLSHAARKTAPAAATQAATHAYYGLRDDGGRCPQTSPASGTQRLSGNQTSCGQRSSHWSWPHPSHCRTWSVGSCGRRSTRSRRRDGRADGIAGTRRPVSTGAPEDRPRSCRMPPCRPRHNPPCRTLQI